MDQVLRVDKHTGNVSTTVGGVKVLCLAQTYHRSRIRIIKKKNKQLKTVAQNNQTVFGRMEDFISNTKPIAR